MLPSSVTGSGDNFFDFFGSHDSNMVDARLEKVVVSPNKERLNCCCKGGKSFLCRIQNLRRPEQDYDSSLRRIMVL